MTATSAEPVGASRPRRALARSLSRRALVLVMTILVGVLLVAPPGAADPRPASARSAVAPQGDLQQLSLRVRKLIKVVEDSTMPCETKNPAVRRLRLLNDAIESGRRSAARTMLQSWADSARTSVAIGLMSAELGATLDNGMRDLLAEIGTGWPEKPRPTRQWKPLPSCGTSTPPGLGEDLEFNSDDLLVLVNGALKMVPKVGSLLAAIVTVLWPSSGNDVSVLIDEAIEASLKQQLTDDLKGLEDLTNLFNTRVSNWQHDCPAWEDPSSWGTNTFSPCYTGAKATSDQWWTTYSTGFTLARPHFQSASPKDYRVSLLPLFAQFENLLIGLLREGMLLEPYWLIPGVGVPPSDAAEPRLAMARELDPNRPAKDLGVSYVDDIYALGLSQQPEPTNQDKWVQRNAYVRSMTTEVLDFRDTWKYFDPNAYPNGLPGGVKLTRMIYSDPIGHVQNWDGFVEPANVLGPMTELTVWQQLFEFTLSTGTNSAIEAMQATSPPSGGPARTGVVTGDASLDLGGATAGRRTWYFDLRTQGPIITVQGRQDRFNIFYFSIANALGFTFASGQTTWIGSHGTDVGTFSYPGYVVATARAVGRYEIGGGHTADAVIFGFRRPDSFLPSAAAISLASGTCLDVVGGALVTSPCHAGASQIWGYYAGTRALVDGDGTCLTLGSDHHSLSAQACTEASLQQWELVPSDDGRSGQIRSVPTGMVLEATGGGLVVAAMPDGGLDQRWAPPSPQEGQVHGIGQGRCMTIPASGSTVIMYSCDQPGSSSTWQLWTYDSAAKTLSLFGGTTCAQATGTTAGSSVVVSGCTGAPNQQWLLNEYNIITSVPSGLILEVQGGGAANGTPVILQQNEDSWSQRWSRPSDQGGALYALGAGKCLDVAAPTDGTQPTIETCSGASGQRWVYHALTQRMTAFNGKIDGGTARCLAVDPGGTKAVITPCSTASNQQWILTRGSDSVTSLVQHTATGQCLTLPGAGTVTAAGTKVEVQPCRSDASQVNQQWQWGGVS